MKRDSYVDWISREALILVRCDVVLEHRDDFVLGLWVEMLVACFCVHGSLGDCATKVLRLVPSVERNVVLIELGLWDLGRDIVRVALQKVLVLVTRQLDSCVGAFVNLGSLQHVALLRVAVQKVVQIGTLLLWHLHVLEKRQIDHVLGEIFLVDLHVIFKVDCIGSRRQRIVEEHFVVLSLARRHDVGKRIAFGVAKCVDGVQRLADVGWQNASHSCLERRWRVAVRLLEHDFRHVRIVAVVAKFGENFLERQHRRRIFEVGVPLVTNRDRDDLRAILLCDLAESWQWRSCHWCSRRRSWCSASWSHKWLGV